MNDYNLSPDDQDEAWNISETIVSVLRGMNCNPGNAAGSMMYLVATMYAQSNRTFDEFFDFVKSSANFYRSKFNENRD